MSKAKQLKLFDNEIYCIDTSSIINLFRPRGLPYNPYPRDIFEGLWIKLENLIKAGQLISHFTVLKDINKKDNEAKKWCNKHRKIFKDVDKCQEEKKEEIKTRYSRSHWDAEINNNQEWSDPWVIALAICEEASIITDEAPDKPDRIPLIANSFGIKTYNLMDFFRLIGLKLRS